MSQRTRALRSSSAAFCFSSSRLRFSSSYMRVSMGAIKNRANCVYVSVGVLAK